MLDSDSTDPSTPTGSSGTAEPQNQPAPRKRAPRKATAKAGPPTTEIETSAAPATETSAPAPRKRAPRKTAAPAETQPDVTVEPAAAEPAAAEPAPARAPRKRPAKKAAAAEPPVATELPIAAEAPIIDPADVTDATATAEPIPAKKAPRKRAAKKAAAVEPAAENASDGTTPTEVTPERTAPAAMTAPSVLFMAPTDEPAPTRRRRVAKKAAGAPVIEEATEALIDDTALETPATDGADTESDEDEDETADPEDVREAAIEQASGARRRRRRGRRGRGGASRSDDSDDADDTDPTDDGSSEAADSDAGDEAGDTSSDDAEDTDEAGGNGTRRRRRRRRSAGGGDDSGDGSTDDPPNTVTHVREKKSGGGRGSGGGGRDSSNKDSSKDSGDDDGVRGIKGSTRLEAKRQRRRDGRDTTRRRAPILTEAEFLARREAVDRVMAVRQNGDRTQIAVLEDGILVEHYVTRASATSYVGNVYLGRVQNVLPSMEAAFIDIGKGRNGVLYAGEVNWDAAGLDGKSRTIEHAMKSGDPVLVQVTKDPIGHKGARLTSQVSLPGRFLVYVPGGGMTGISRRLPDTERSRLKSILKKIVPDEAGVIVRTAAEGASEEDLTHDVERLQAQWESIKEHSQNTKAAPTLLHGEPDLAIRVVRDVFNEDFGSLVVEGDEAWSTISGYLEGVAPDLAARASRHVKDTDLFHDLRVDEQLMKALDRKVWLPSGGSLVIDRTEAMTVVDVNTGKFVGSGGNLEQTVTRNNLEAAEEIVRQLRLRDVGGIVVIDFIDMVLESNRDLVLRRLTECLGRDRTKHQVAEVTSLGLVQMTRKRVGEGLLEAFSEPCEHCHGRGVLIHSEPVDQSDSGSSDDEDRPQGKGKRRRGGRAAVEPAEVPAEPPATPEQRQAANAAIAAIHRATAAEQAAAEAGESAAQNGSDAEGGDLIATLATNLVAATREAESDTPDTSSAAEPADAVDATVAESALVQTSAPNSAASDSDAGAADGSELEVVDVSSSNGSPAPGRRRRRTASRPAGPPVAAS